MVQCTAVMEEKVRLSRERIERLAKIVMEGLLKSGLIVHSGGKEALLRNIEGIIEEEVAAEIRLNAEVEEILKSYQKEIEKGNVDYHKMFQMVKSQLVKKRGIIL